MEAITKSLSSTTGVDHKQAGIRFNEACKNEHEPDNPFRESSNEVCTPINRKKFQNQQYNSRLPLKPNLYSNPLMTQSITSKKMSSLVVKSSLIEPDSGSLVDLVVVEDKRGFKIQEAESMPKVNLTKIDLEWVHVLSEEWEMPIVLAIEDEDKERIGGSPDVALVGPGGDLVGILRSIEIYKHHKEERIARTWGTTVPGLPYVEEVITPADSLPNNSGKNLTSVRRMPFLLFSLGILCTTGMLC
ncbi:hypothetical protein Vadar_005174 [Vaccinium darrowii]|uniref:Uncharacterized protein n=1 Tax=Vaccinium darrowii TaxID=229202 RepID=A0ACB7YJQ3_9ERIC|nr:hypothetical protein Vadar_005174 [Vaccinium darrowii]